MWDAIRLGPAATVLSFRRSASLDLTFERAIALFETVNMASWNLARRAWIEYNNDLAQLKVTPSFGGSCGFKAT